MFQESLVQSNSLLRARKGLRSVISFASLIAIALALMVVPRMHAEHDQLAGPAGAARMEGLMTAAPVRVSWKVMSGQLLEPLQLEIPKIAKLRRDHGTVVVIAVISKAGLVESARVVSGPEMLQAAALQAVRATRYRPFMLNGQPTEVETTINITYGIQG